ncbi:amino acid ABC transporter substrate-binding protein [Nakamurella antarctica]|uniref:Amino acid ABC transporter substrate-binding protein n=1 Tax=Nakamurella antarctica TaxID=1902245 RepID=A0A3G8ZQ01_9ACTN|nr:transporter substrate-binding domain-containing protein [Nakamurella antarctica]AZI59319.1 amino acid ABC transporter substrate-binding protein [Nakamurella antarctica]
MSQRRQAAAAALLAASMLALAACSSDSSSASAPSSASSASADASASASDAPSASGSAAAPGAVGAGCNPTDLTTMAPKSLLLATSEPAFEPWMVDNDPTTGKGFESAVAYAVAEKLGYTKEQIFWMRVSFEAGTTPGPKPFDFDINQYSISAQRAEAVDFSSSYYDITQAVITVKGSSLEKASDLASLKGAKLGAMLGTTSLDAISASIDPTNKPAVFDDNTAGAAALQNGQIDGLVVDLPTAFYMTGAQLTDGIVIGQLPPTSTDTEQLGLILQKDSPLTKCVTAAVDALRADGTLASLADQWLAGSGAPVLK